MKNFIKELGKSTTISFVVTLTTLLGLCAAGLLWTEKLEPWLKRILHINTEEEES